MTQLRIPAVYMRGGTSKGVFFLAGDLPPDPGARDRILLRAVGSPDPYGKQIDGMGGGTSSTSKVVIVSKSSRPDCDVDYLFGAVSVTAPVIDWSGNCGNLTAAVGPFAIGAGLLAAPAEGTAAVRIWQANIGKRIIAHVPMRAGDVQEDGSFRLDGVAFPAAEVKLEFIDPAGEDARSDAGATFPTRHEIDLLEIPGLGTIEATLINAGNPTIFIDAAALRPAGHRAAAGRQRHDAPSSISPRRCGPAARSPWVSRRSPEEATAKRPTHSQGRLRRKTGRVYGCRTGRRIDPAVDRPAGADLLHGQAAPCDDGHGRRGHRRRRGDSRNDRASHRAPFSRTGPCGSVTPPALLSVGAEAVRREGQWIIQQGSREPIGTPADGRLGPCAAD